MAPLAWSLAQYVVGDSGTRLGILDAEGVVLRPPASITCQSVMELLQDWPRWSDVLATLDPNELSPIDKARLVAPLTYPNKVICAGANYYDHAEEMGTARPDPDAEPFFFLKSPTTTLVGPNADVAIRHDGRSNVDWEAELGVVIGRRCTSLDEEESKSAIAGYVVANDISDRGVFHRDGAVFPAFDWDWVGHKSQDGFCPIGPGVMPAHLVPDPQALKIRLDVNGIVKQDSNTSQMVSDVNRLVAAASRLMTLEPGDLILTGTPAGVGLPRKEFLQIGDVVSVEIQGLGRISNRMVGK